MSIDLRAPLVSILWLSFFPWSALLLISCGDDPKDTGLAYSQDIILSDQNNYNFEGSLTIASADVAEQQDVLFDWSGLTIDLMGHDMDPSADVGLASVVVFPYDTQEQITEDLSNDELMQSSIGLYVGVETEGRTSVYLSELLTLFGYDIGIVDYLTDAYQTWMFLLNSGTTPGIDSRMLMFFDPEPGSDNNAITVQNSSAQLEVDVDLTSLQPLTVLAGSDNYVDWSGVTTDARGREINLSTTDQIMVSRYLSLTAQDLESQFLDVEILADGMWSASIGGATSITLADLTDDGGSPFPGLDADYLWLLALQCSSCLNPAPPYLTVLDVK